MRVVCDFLFSLVKVWVMFILVYVFWFYWFVRYKKLVVNDNYRVKVK